MGRIKWEQMEWKRQHTIIHLCLEASSSSVKERKLKWRENRGVMGLRPPPGGPIAHTNIMSTSLRNEPVRGDTLQLTAQLHRLEHIAVDVLVNNYQSTVSITTIELVNCSSVITTFCTTRSCDRRHGSRHCTAI